MALASRSNRSENCAAETLMATSRFKRGSLARYTSPMPPAPMGPRISYGPSLSPTDSGIGAMQLSLADQRADCARMKIGTSTTATAKGSPPLKENNRQTDILVSKERFDL